MTDTTSKLDMTQRRCVTIRWFYGPEKSGKRGEIARWAEGVQDATAQLVWDGDDVQHRLKQLLERVSIVDVESNTPPPPDLWDTVLDIPCVVVCLFMVTKLTSTI
jgi:hypothetical protein